MNIDIFCCVAHVLGKKYYLLLDEAWFSIGCTSSFSFIDVNIKKMCLKMDGYGNHLEVIMSLKSLIVLQKSAENRLGLSQQELLFVLFH